MPDNSCARTRLHQRRKCTSWLLGTATVLAWACQAAAGSPLTHQTEWEDRLGYQYEGKVRFVQSAKRATPRATFEQDPSQLAPTEHRTILITRDGSKFSKRLAVHDWEEPVRQASATQFSGQLPGTDLWEDLARNISLSRRRLQQSSDIVISSTTIDLTCQGCDTTDTRTRVDPTTTYPHTALGRLIGQLTGSTSGLECSGTLIGSRHVITAAHCVFDINDSREYVEALDFSPALNANLAPYGTLAWETVRVLNQFTSQKSYTSTAMNYDFALITLKDTASTATGYLAMFQPPNTGSQTVSITTAGYPGEKPDGTMWTSSCSNIAFGYAGAGPTAFRDIQQCASGGCANIVQHHCLSSDGQSGSGMWDPNVTVRAILSGKVQTSDGNDYNVGTMIDTFVYNTIAQWYNDDGGDNGNKTLPLTPTAGTPGSGSSNSQNGLKNLKISTPWVIAVIAAGGGLLLVAIVAWLWSCCTRRRKDARRAKDAARPNNAAGLIWGDRRGPQQQYGAQGQAPQPNPVYGQAPRDDWAQRNEYGDRGYGQRDARFDQGGQGGYPPGVVYDERTGQFMVNGIPYGHYPYN